MAKNVNSNSSETAKPKLVIAHLYPREMNIYGDTGNLLILKKRAEWRGISVEILLIGVGDEVPKDVDIILGGGGQDAGQNAVQTDLQTKAVSLIRLANNNVVMLMICGMYQLFGRSFTTHEGMVIKGIGILPLETVAGSERMIGNTVYQSQWGELVGYENHSGVTCLDNEADKLAVVSSGCGNNNIDGSEGARFKNVFGTYSHGPFLSKNPHFADMLLQTALDRKYHGRIKMRPLDDRLEMLAHESAKTRPR